MIAINAAARVVLAFGEATGREAMRRASAGLGAMVAAAWGGAVWAQDDFATRYEALLIEGRLVDAAGLAEGRIAAAPDDAEAGFALGLAQFLSAVEGLGQGLYRYGLASTYGNPAAQALGGGVPFLRIPIPANPSPEPVTYDGLRAVLGGFVRDLAVAEKTLAAVPASAFELPLRVPLVRLDFDGNGTGGPEESVAALFLAVSGVDLVSPEWAAWAGAAEEGRLPPFGLDESEVPWLQGYSHLLSALGEFLLAHDWETAFQSTFHAAFPAGDLASSGLAAEDRRVIDGLGPEPPRVEWGEEGYDEWASGPGGEAHRAWSSQRGLSEWAGIADLIAFVHLMRWPVVEPDRMGAAREHLLSMVALSRENWRRILAETDDSREWVPGPQQTVLFDGMRITDETVAGWHMFLDEFEAVLDGQRLIPHWRIADGRGINMRRMFEEPMAFDPWLIAQGSAILPFLEDGETVSPETVFTIFMLTDGGLLRYFLWFN
jgi:hypothetical protein